jgi:hypothetical protein
MPGIAGWIAGLVLERPVRDLSLSQMVDRLESAGERLAQRLGAASDSPANRSQLRHMVGIERWGHRRLCAVFGEPLVLDEYDDYRPAANLSWDKMRAAFRAARAETVALTRRLEAEGVDSRLTAPHNQWGPLTVRGWLRYLDIHANLEAKRIR